MSLMINPTSEIKNIETSVFQNGPSPNGEYNCLLVKCSLDNWVLRVAIPGVGSKWGILKSLVSHVLNFLSFVIYDKIT